MQLFRQIDSETAALVGWAVRVLLLAADAGAGAARLADRLAGFGGIVEPETDLFAAAEALQGETAGFGLLVMDCDGYGGLQAGRRMLTLIGRAAERVPVILIAAEVGTQAFPERDGAPVLLRAPPSAVSLRVGFEHALRHRLVHAAA